MTAIPNEDARGQAGIFKSRSTSSSLALSLAAQLHDGTLQESVSSETEKARGAILLVDSTSFFSRRLVTRQGVTEFPVTTPVAPKEDAAMWRLVRRR